MSSQPAGPPPSYQEAAQGGRPGAPQQQQAATTSTSTGAGHQPERHSSIDNERDIENEDRPLPPGWVPQYSEEHDRFFFVDTKNPKGPRSIWVHPLDDAEWLRNVPRGMSPEAYVDQLWNEQPMPTPEAQHRTIPSQAAAQNRQGGGSMQQQQQGQNLEQYGRMVNGKRVVTLEDLTQMALAKMGTPAEYEKRNPPSKASKLFHKKETAAQRQRRHARHKAEDMADALSYRAPAYPPVYGGYGPRYGPQYGYPGYGRGYGGMYPGLGMSGAFLGLGAGALLGGALF